MSSCAVLPAPPAAEPVPTAGGARSWDLLELYLDLEAGSGLPDGEPADDREREFAGRTAGPGCGTVRLAPRPAGGPRCWAPPLPGGASRASPRAPGRDEWARERSPPGG